MSKESPALPIRGCQNVNLNISDYSHNTRTKTPRKLTKTLKIFAVLASGKSLNMFEGEEIGDHVLRSTVSTIQKLYQVKIQRKKEKIKNRFGSKTEVCRYWIANCDLSYARKLIAKEFIKRGIVNNIYAAHARIQSMSDE